MRKLLWIGSFLDEKTYQIVVSQGYRNAASYVSQKNLLEGIENEGGIKFDAIGAVAMAGYPRQGKPIMHSYRFSHACGTEDVLTGYFNPLYLNKFFMNRAMLKAAKYWIEERYTVGDEIEIFVYEMRSACIDTAIYIKKMIKDVKIHLIIPDLPCFMDLHMSRVKRMLKKIDWNHMLGNFEYVDDFLPYTETMVDYLGIRSKKWMVMEGSINKRDIKRITSEIRRVGQRSTDKKIIMYCGWIDQSFGIDQLVGAMEYLDDSYELWITGGGPYEATLRNKISGNNKVKYYGFLPTREELFKLQSQASVMMNMRDPKIEAAHFCFPSKLFEYMLLGKPVLSVKLKGIPEEYRRFLFEFNELTEKHIAEAIKKVMMDPKREEKAVEARNFVIEEKNNFSMAKKIIKFIGE